jgi:hypothetical protein
MSTWTVEQSGGDYTTLASALSNASTVNGDIISIEGTWTVDDTAPADIVDDVTIHTDSDSRHNGNYDESDLHYRLVHSSTSAHGLELDGAYTATVDGITMVNSSPGTSRECFRCQPDTGDTVLIKNCIFDNEQGTSQQDGVYLGFRTPQGTTTFENNIFTRHPRGGINAQQDNTDVIVININSCTFFKCGTNPGTNLEGGGYTQDAHNQQSNLTLNVHNSLFIDCSTVTGSGDGSTDINMRGTQPSLNASYSIVSDTSFTVYLDTGTGNLESRTASDSDSPGTGDWVIFEDITTAPYDLRLKTNAENDAEDMHTDATEHGITIPSTDIVGTSRPQNTNYDCGVFEIVVAAGAAPVIAFRVPE